MLREPPRADPDGTGLWQHAGRGPRELAAVAKRLHSADSVAELLRQASAEAAAWCGFDRALILTVEEDHLSGTLTGALGDPGSDGLRRRVLASPVQLHPGTAEAEFIRHAEGGRAAGGQAPSDLQSALGLKVFALGAVMPEERVLALLVLDRDEPEATPLDGDAAQFFAHVIGLAVERLFLRLRMRELALELRHLTASAQAAMKEALEAPVALPVDYGSGPVFTTMYPAAQSSDQLRELLTPRELQIANQLAAGRSNREIATELHLSPETIKGYVARVLRKLGASNRADAVSRYLRLSNTANDR